MPALKNARHERFAQGLAVGKTADEAYVLAGFRPNRGNAARLNANESVRKRVRELQAKVAERAEWSAADRLLSLKAIHDAQIEKDARVAISAIAEANKMQGSHAAAKLQHSGAIGTYDLTKLGDDELDKLESILGPLAHDGGDPGGENPPQG